MAFPVFQINIENLLRVLNGLTIFSFEFRIRINILNVLFTARASDASVSSPVLYF